MKAPSTKEHREFDDYRDDKGVGDDGIASYLSGCRFNPCFTNVIPRSGSTKLIRNEPT